jgi:hypothetical protein
MLSVIDNFNCGKMPNFDGKMPKYTEQDYIDIVNLFTEMFPEEYTEYKKSSSEKKIREPLEAEYDKHEFVFKDIYTQMSEEKGIELYVLVKGEKQYLYYDMNKDSDTYVMFDDRIPVEVEFFNTESGGNLKCNVYYDSYISFSNNDLKIIKKSIEAILYDIEEFSKNYFKAIDFMNLKYNDNELPPDEEEEEDFNEYYEDLDDADDSDEYDLY